MKSRRIPINGLTLFLAWDEHEPVSMLDVTTQPYDARGDEGGRLLRGSRVVEVQAAGCNQDDHHGNKYTLTSPGNLLRHESITRQRTSLGPALQVVQKGGGLTVTSHLQFLGKLPAWRSWTTVANSGGEQVLLEYVSTFALGGLARGGPSRWDERMQLSFADNTWCGENQWRTGSLPEHGLACTYSPLQPGDSGLKRISIANQGSWSTLGYLPLGILENRQTGDTYFWQIEHNGSWHWELSDFGSDLYVRLSGPTYRESLWTRRLLSGQEFTTVPATFGRVQGGLDAALRRLTETRRLIRRPHRDLEEMPVVFNDYMNCLQADPTTEKLRPVIDAAARAGCEYFVVDAGWYSKLGAGWWSSVGEWQESASRFPGGLRAVIDQIRARDMVPGLWLEIEVMGITCPLAPKLPDSWFFQRAGRRLIDHGRYLLDFRNAAVREHADNIVDRIVRDYRLGYIKNDYNVNAGPGTDFGADSPGQGLLEHNRAFLAWIDAVHERHPGLVIENCGSGGLRMDYAQLAHHAIQSVSDQTDYRLNAVIAAASAAAVAPEQAAVWSYPIKDGTREETVMNMVNAMLLRIHQSGRLHEISAARFALVQEGIAVHKVIRRQLRQGLPFWPLGLQRFGADWTAFGMDCGKTRYLAVWRLRGTNARQALPLPDLAGKRLKASILYPRAMPVPLRWNTRSGELEVTLPASYSARLLQLDEI